MRGGLKKFMRDYSVVNPLGGDPYIKINLDSLDTLMQLSQKQGNLLFRMVHARERGSIISNNIISISAATVEDFLRKIYPRERLPREQLYDLVLRDIIISITDTEYIINPRYISIAPASTSKVVLSSIDLPDYAKNAIGFDTINDSDFIKLYRDFPNWISDLRKAPRNVLLLISSMVSKSPVVRRGVPCIDVEESRRYLMETCGLRKCDFEYALGGLLDLWYLFPVCGTYVSVNPYLIGFRTNAYVTRQRLLYNQIRSEECEKDESMSDSCDDSILTDQSTSFRIKHPVLV